MTAGVILLNFGEPQAPTLETVTAYLERIFVANASLEEGRGEAGARERSRELAERRAPGLLEEYREIGGSPLNRQAEGQARALATELSRRGHEVWTYVSMQFADPLIPDAVDRARSDGVGRLVGLPVYPLCGPSTTVAALAELARAVQASGWEVELLELSGWHRHPAYRRLRADAIRRYAAAAGVDLAHPRTRLVFSAHGTPLKYLEEGSRYEVYVREWCRSVAEELGASFYDLGFQNHSSRGIPWTRPEIEEAVQAVEADRVVVDAVSFMHEQSETLAELDIDLRKAAEEAGLEFHRVPIPHDDPRFVAVLADLVEPLLTDGVEALLAAAAEPPAAGGPDPAVLGDPDAAPERVGEDRGTPLRFARCRCRRGETTLCLNAPPSPLQCG